MAREIDGHWFSEWLWKNRPERVAEILGYAPEGLQLPRQDIKRGGDWKSLQAGEESIEEDFF